MNWRVVFRPICWLAEHRSRMWSLPEHGFGLYAFSKIDCSRCGLTLVTSTIHYPEDMDPCGECAKGKCDDCEWCVDFRQYA